MKIWMFLIIFLLVGAFFIISQNNLALSQQGNFQKFVGLYSTWFGKLAGNGVNIAGYVVKMNWLPD